MVKPLGRQTSAWFARRRRLPCQSGGRGNRSPAHGSGAGGYYDLARGTSNLPCILAVARAFVFQCWCGEFFLGAPLSLAACFADVVRWVLLVLLFAGGLAGTPKVMSLVFVMHHSDSGACVLKHTTSPSFV